MDAQHTPGPWQFGIRGAGFQTAELATVFQIPRMPTEDGLGQGWAYISAEKPCYELTADEREANGHLMAAAPDLLEALREAKEILDLVAMTPLGPAETGSTAEKINRAIAKAEGRP